MKLVIFGATGQTGQLIVEQALARGHNVTATTRRPDAIALKHDQLRVLCTHLLDDTAMHAAIANQDAVLSAVGGPMSRAVVTAHADSARAILQTMHAAGVKRFVGVTSGGTNPEHDPDLPLIFEQVFKRIFINIYRDQMNMEQLVMASDADWTLVRPAALTNGVATGRCRIAEAYAIRGGNQTPRADLAAFMLDVIEQHTFVRKAVALAC